MPSRAKCLDFTSTIFLCFNAYAWLTKPALQIQLCLNTGMLITLNLNCAASAHPCPSGKCWDGEENLFQVGWQDSVLGKSLMILLHHSATGKYAVAICRVTERSGGIWLRPWKPGYLKLGPYGIWASLIPFEPKHRWDPKTSCCFGCHVNHVGEK